LGLSADYVVGLVDGEGSFQVKIEKSLDMRTGFRIILAFQVGFGRSHKNLEVLKRLRDFFKVGEVYVGDKSVVYLVQDIHDICRVVIPFFSEHKLFLKGEDFEVWKELAFCLRRRRHLSWSGLRDEVIPLVERLYSLRREKRPRKMLEVLKREVDRHLAGQGWLDVVK